MITILLVADAFATDYTLDVCARIGIDFVDVDVSSGDDYITSNTDVPARGAHIKIQRTDVFPYQTVADGYTEEDGGTSYAGCLMDRVLSSTHTYKVTVYSEALVNNQTLEVFTAGGGTTLTTYTSANFTPSSTATWTATTTSNDDWNIFAAASYAVWRDDIGGSSHTITAYSATCPTGSGSCFDTQAVYISSSGSSYKYLIAHEIGHELLFHRYGSSGADGTATPGVCVGDLGDPTGAGGHHFISKEYQGAAFWEGFANYYATASFNNNSSQTDGVFYLYKSVDWNRDGTDEEPAQFIDVSVASPTIQDPGDTPSSFTADGTNYLAAYCSAGNNRGTEYDWIRFLWYMDTTKSMSPGDFGAIYYDARTNGGGYYQSGSGSGAGYPSSELYSATARLNSTWAWNWSSYDGYFGVSY